MHFFEGFPIHLCCSVTLLTKKELDSAVNETTNGQDFQPQSVRVELMKTGRPYFFPKSCPLFRKMI